MSSAKKEASALNVLFTLVVTLVTIWLVVASVYLVAGTQAAQGVNSQQHLGTRSALKKEQGMGAVLLREAWCFRLRNQTRQVMTLSCIKKRGWLLSHRTIKELSRLRTTRNMMLFMT